MAIVCSGVLPWTNSHAQASPYTLNWSSITAGGVAHLHSSCFELSGSIDFIGLPGILSASPNNYVVYTGFWAAAPIFGLDEIFFNGFEDCKL
ncbi:MAG TPA: hypothetical protein VFI32_00690 [Rhodanobacteraceae bacterium]|nr:hypothetical protein [Rhodanobacteraceae bacterium]